MSTVRSRKDGLRIPEVGQVVRCRGQVWAVNEVAGSSQLADPFTDVGRHHMIRLTSLEDDGFGVELTVIWEVEPGTEIIPRQELPRPELGRLDPPARLSAFLDAVRWGAVATADTQALQSPFRAGITIEEYQLDPVVRALSMPRVNLLVADDVGLGKTIEAGLVVQELLLRHRAHSVMVVCPASLCVKWKEEMRDRFGLEFRIVNTAAVRQLRRDRGVGANIFTSFPRLIVSIDWLKGTRAQSLLDEVLVGFDHRRGPRRFDMLIVDEVHSAVPSGRGRYAVDSLRTRAIKRLAPHCEHRLFLSATPHNGYQVSFTALLEMLDPQRFARGVEPNPRQLARVLVRRLKRELRDELPPRGGGVPVFPERRVVEVPVEYPDDERWAHEQLNRYAELRRGRNRSGSGRSATNFVTLLLKKRLLSSSAAFANTLAEHRATMARAASSAPASERQIRAAWDRAVDDSGDDDSGDSVAEALRTVGRGQAHLSGDEQQLLDELASWAESRRYSTDARAEALIMWLTETCRDEAGGWNDERVIVFTEYRDTQKWLYDLLLNRGLGGRGGDRIALLFGGMEEHRRERTKAKFQADPSRSPLRILLATDAASEGIDLQRHCWRLLHWEIPWNPSRLEQRNGRVDRHGQQSPVVEVRHFVPEGWAEQPRGFATEMGFLSLVAWKVEQIREDLGSVGLVLSNQISEAMLGHRHGLDQAALDRARSHLATGVLRVERKLRRELDRCHEKLEASIDELGLTPERVERVVQTALEIANQPSLLPGPEFGTFRLPVLAESWQRAGDGMTDRLSGEPLPFSFNRSVVGGRDDVVFAHLGHRLVAQSLRLLRAEVWATGADRKLARVAVRLVAGQPRILESGDIGLLCHARLVLTGAGGHRLHEELVIAGGRLRSGRFAAIRAQRDLSALLASASEDAVEADAAMNRVAADWDDIAKPGLDRALNRRSEDVQESRLRALQSRADAEANGVRQVLGDLQTQIDSELRNLEIAHIEQLSLFSDSERDQAERDLDALRRRLDEIPDEIEREVAAIRRRYSDPEPHVFPAAVTILVPRGDS